MAIYPQRVLDINAQIAAQSQAPSAGRTLNAVYNPPVTQQVPQDEPDYATWGNSILEMLKQQQQQAQQGIYANQQQQVQRATSDLPSDLANLRLSPSQIGRFRQGEATSQEATIGGERARISEATQGIANVKDFLKGVQEEENRKRDDARSVISNALTIGGADSLQGLDSNELKTLEKQAGYPSGYLEGITRTLKERELELKKMSGSGDGLTPFQRLSYKNQLEDNMRGNPAVKSYGELVSFGVPTVIERFNKGQTDSVADTVLMRTLAKVTDPTTGVREEEYRTFEGATGALNRLFVMPKSWVGKGRLTAEGRSQMIREIQDRFNAKQKDYNEQYGYYKSQAEQGGITIPPPYLSSTPISSKNATNELNNILNTPSTNQVAPNRIFQSSSQPTSQTTPTTSSGGWFDKFLNTFGL